MTDRIERHRQTQKIRTAKHTEDYREWIKNGTPEQKALWKREQQIHNKPELRAEYNQIVTRLQSFLPPSEMASGGKYGRSESHYHEDGELEGLKCHLRRY